MKYINILDEKQRLMRIDYYPNMADGQYNSHSISYLRAREMLTEAGEIMGFDMEVMKDETGINSIFTDSYATVCSKL